MGRLIPRKVSSETAIRDGAKYTVSFRLGGSDPVKRSVKVFLSGDRS